jgi:hypothetical protein
MTGENLIIKSPDSNTKVAQNLIPGIRLGKHLLTEKNSVKHRTA